jgi:hypothetical protein
MRYKNNVLDRLVQADAAVLKVMFQVNRGMAQDDIIDSIEQLKENLEGIREMISIEPDDFEQQFRG